jgi:hypothetical protein
MAQTRHPLLWWGMNSTLFGKYPLDQHPEPHGTSSSTLNACESMCVKPIGYIGPTRSASFPTDVNNALTRFAWAHPLVVIDLGQWCDKKAHVKVTKAVLAWLTTGEMPRGDISVNYVIANLVHPVPRYPIQEVIYLSFT